MNYPNLTSRVRNRNNANIDTSFLAYKMRGRNDLNGKESPKKFYRSQKVSP